MKPMKTTVELVALYVLQISIVVGVHVLLNHLRLIVELVVKFVILCKHVATMAVQIFNMMQQTVEVVK
jgi:hypothetical protein